MQKQSVYPTIEKKKKSYRKLCFGVFEFYAGLFIMIVFNLPF